MERLPACSSASPRSSLRSPSATRFPWSVITSDKSILDQGIALAESGDPLSARASFERAQGLVHADDPRAEHYLGLLSLRLWDVPAALVHLERASTIVSRPPEYWVAVALLGSAPNLPREEPALARVIVACRARDFAAASELVAAGPRPDSEGTLSALWDMLACWTAVERGQPPPTASAVELFAETGTCQRE